MRNCFICLISLTGVLFFSCSQKKESSFNERASALPLADMEFNPLDGQLITSGIDTVRHQLFTLYGNFPAVNHARFHARTGYPAGAVLSKVTWAQQPDAHWFGANVPSSVIAVEVVRFITGSDGIVRPGYRHYSGDGSGADAVLPRSEIEERVSAISAIRASVLP